MAIGSWEKTDRFVRDYKKLDKPTQAKVDDVLRALVPWPTARSLRHHTLNGYTPPIHVVDITSNKAYQMTFNVVGTVAKLLRVSTHGQIDRNPE